MLGRMWWCQSGVVVLYVDPVSRRSGPSPPSVCALPSSAIFGSPAVENAIGRWRQSRAPTRQNEATRRAHLGCLSSNLFGGCGRCELFH